ncbi:YbbR domain-containing protein [Salsuginibacillus halophilus]|uniref:YbbR domain-containing protein n=1 Tax=Salsuginibacillus halophilus TaxID=517424 RepID=A0A2P8H3P1_9BACI|nr:CdaR family protein [Salsuginibacillus halophilus]PSL40832.1 YbbR domain-containing protein [Salsuginibacillus halophilus]
MDKMFNNHWFVKFISLLIAFMLFMMVNMDDFNNQAGVLPTVNEGTLNLEDEEITAYYDEESYDLVELNETVDVQLTGPQSALRLFQITQGNYEVYVDLEDRGAGVHHATVEHQGFPAELGISVVPEFVRVELEERMTASLPVNAELNNEEDMAPGYEAETPVVEPSEVEVTGPRSVLDEIEDVYAFVDMTEADSDVTQDVDVVVYGELGNELEVDIVPESVEVTVPVTTPSVTVPVNLTREGELPEGLGIEDIALSPNEITLYGPLDVIENIETLDGVVLNLDDVTESGTYELDVQAPPGVERAEPETVEADVEVAEEDNRDFSGVPIDFSDVPDDADYSVEAPEDQAADVTLYGAEEFLLGMDRSDFRIYVDEDTADEDNEEWPIQYDGPEETRHELSPTVVEVEWNEED